MIDFIRVHYKDKSSLEVFIQDPDKFDNLYSKMNFHTGEIMYPYKTNMHNMEITINEKSGYVKNSLHKLYNVLKTNREHNYNDFAYSNMMRTIAYLESKVIDISSNPLTQFEFGLNIKVPQSAQELISRHVLMHNFESHTNTSTYKGRGYLKGFEHYNYIIKIYDKAKQYKTEYKLEDNILRFEIKYTSSKEFNPLGVYTLKDLKDKNVLNTLFEYLLKRFDELIIVDEYSIETVSKADFNKLNIYSSCSYWKRFEKLSRQSKMVHKKKYTSLLKENNLFRTKSMLRELLIEKFEHLINN